MDLKLEKNFWKRGYKIVIGLDEAGRGALAGPVCAAAVMILKDKESVLNEQFQKILKLACDSKKLAPKKREKIFEMIKKCPSIKYQYCFIDEKIIDRININRATEEAMKKSLINLISKEEKNKIMVLVDGNKKISQLNLKQKTIIKGDDKIFSIALASIVAKVMRDRKIEKLSKKYPQYFFEIHKGYPTKKHLQMIKKYGPSKIHRKSYRPLKA